MALASLTVDLTLALSRFEADSGKAAQIVNRDAQKMAAATEKADAAVRRFAASFGRVGVESKVVSAALAGASDDALKLLANVEAGASSFSRVGAAGAAAFKAVGAAADSSLQSAENRILLIAEKARQVRAQAEQLKAAAVAQNAAGTLDDDGLKKRLADIRAVQQAELQRIAATARADADAERAAQARAAQERADLEARQVAARKLIDTQNGLTAAYREQLRALRDLRDAGAITPAQFRQAGADLVARQPAVQQRQSAEAAAAAATAAAARAERVASSRALAAAQAGSDASTIEAQTRVYLAFANAQMQAAEAQAQAEARVAQAQTASAAASERGRAAQLAAYETKVAYIAKVNEEAAALFRTKDAQRSLDAQRAGVSPAEADKLAKVTGDREFLAGIRQQIDAQQRLGESYERTTIEILRQQAAERGLTNTAAGSIGRLERLIQANNAAAEAAQRRKAADSFLASLNERAAGINADGTQKAQSQLLAEKAAILGVGKEAEAAIAKIAALDGKTGQLGKSAFASRNQLLTLQYTIGDVIASAGSGASPLTILLQQGPQLAQVEGGITGIFKTGISLITPFRAAMAGAVTAISAVGFAWYQGAQQSKAFNDAIVLSGNFAGQTEGTFNALAQSIADSGKVTASAAREIGEALIATGEVGPAVFAKATAVAVLYGKATGQTAKEVAQSFASMTRDATAWATENNRSLNFVSAAQLQLIRSMQESGRSSEAQTLILDALNTRLQALEPNLGLLDRAIRVVTTSWGRFWDAAFAIGRNDTIEDKIAALRQKIAGAQAPAATETDGGAALVAQSAGRRTATREAINAQDAARLDGLLREQNQQRNAAFLQATAAATTKAATEGRANVESLLKGAKAASVYSKELDKLNRDIEANKRAGTPFSAEEERIAREELKKRSTDKPSRGAEKDAAAERRALLDKDLAAFAAALAKEKDALKFHQDELRAIYDAGAKALSAYYDEREAATKRGTQAELDEQAKAIGRLSDELKRGDLKRDERVRLEKQLADAQAKAADIQRDADNAAKLATYERAAAVKALAREVENFQATLAELQGDPLGAANLRASQQIDAARQLSTRSGGGLNVDAYARAVQIGNEFAEVQRRVSVATADAGRAEEAFLLRARAGGASLKEQEQGVYALRSASLSQLGELTQAAARLAEASTDPRVKAFAADLALQYARAAEVVDPAFNRLKAHGDDLASSLSGVFSGAIAGAEDLNDTVDAIGRTIQASLTKAFIIEPVEGLIRGGIRDFLGSGNPIAAAMRSAAGVSDAGEAAAKAAATAATTAQTLATQTAATSMAQLTIAATSASAALTAMAGAGLASSAAGGLLDLVAGGGFGNSAPFGFSSVFHAGGIVGRSGAVRAVSSAIFAGAQRYHAGGIIGNAVAAALGPNEVPAILMGGPKGTREEVLHASDPRHRDNLSAEMLRMLDAGGGIKVKAAAGGIPRYHAGGLVGMSPDGMAAMAYRNSRMAPMPQLQATQPPSGGNVYITNNAPAKVESVQRDERGDWRILINAAAEQAHARVAADVASGSGRVAASMKARGVNLDGANPRRG